MCSSNDDPTPPPGPPDSTPNWPPLRDCNCRHVSGCANNCGINDPDAPCGLCNPCTLNCKGFRVIDYSPVPDDSPGTVSPSSPPGSQTSGSSGTSGLYGAPAFKNVAVYINEIKYCIPMITDLNVELCLAGED